MATTDTKDASGDAYIKAQKAAILSDDAYRKFCSASGELERKLDAALLAYKGFILTSLTPSVETERKLADDILECEKDYIISSMRRSVMSEEYSRCMSELAKAKNLYISQIKLSPK